MLAGDNRHRAALYELGRRGPFELRFRNANGDQEVQHIGHAAQARTGALLDLRQAVTRRVGVDIEPLGRKLGVEIGPDVLQERRDQDATLGDVVGDERAHGFGDAAACRVLSEEGQAVECAQTREREHAAGRAHALGGGDRLAVGLRHRRQTLVQRADADRQRHALVGEVGVGAGQRLDDPVDRVARDRRDDHDLVLAHDRQRLPGAGERPRERRRAGAQVVLVVERRGGRRHDDDTRARRRQAGLARGGQLRSRARRMAREQVLEQVAAHALALCEQQPLSLDVHLGRLARGDVHVPHDDRGQRERLAASGVVRGGGQHRVPEDLRVDPERVHEVPERQAADAARGARADELDLLAGQRPAELDAANERIVLLGDVRPHVGDEARIGDRRIARDLRADPEDAFVDELLPARAQRIEHPLQRRRSVVLHASRRHGSSS